jgi:hypothetical protein
MASDGCNVTVAGATETETGDRRTTEAAPEIAGFVTLVAFTSMIWQVGIELGAVYNPLDEIVPTAGKSDQVTPESVPPLMAALKFWVCEAASVTMAGDTETVDLAGLGAAGALPVSAGFATLCASVTEAGAAFACAPFRVTQAGAAKAVTDESSDMTACANFMLSAMLVAVIRTLVCKFTLPGEVYPAVSPLVDMCLPPGLPAPVFVVRPSRKHANSYD